MGHGACGTNRGAGVSASRDTAGQPAANDFFAEPDYALYLSLLKDWLGRWGNRLLAYCLMPNHVHLIVVPGSEDGLARGIGEVHRRYTRAVNFRQGWRGHPHVCGAFRRHENTGRPLGGEAFVRRIGELLGRDLVQKKPGPAPAKGR